MSQVWEIQLGRSERDVLLVMADHANDDGVCWPSRALICWMTGLSEATVKRALTGLREKNLITCVANELGGSGKVPIYELRLRKGIRKRPFSPQK
jgi:hypothetical protein